VCARNAEPPKVAANPNLICWRETHPLVACNEQEDVLLCRGARRGPPAMKDRWLVGETRLRKAYVAASFMVFLKRTARARQSAATAAVRHACRHRTQRYTPDGEPCLPAPIFGAHVSSRCPLALPVRRHVGNAFD
jgi:hypothetical protein